MKQTKNVMSKLWLCSVESNPYQQLKDERANEVQIAKLRKLDNKFVRAKFGEVIRRSKLYFVGYRKLVKQSVKAKLILNSK